ncbi:MAG: glycosyltransferase family 39 protein, partial [Deltaproteobacteria bacterium]|nr:glycosyltransferase family 39 protein [Deltaproteobacteria bacterium]
MSKQPKTSVPLATILVIGVVYTLIIVWLPSDVFWITDGGNKFIQVQSMRLSGLPDVSIQYPAKDIDPDLTFFPYCGHHFKKVGDKIYSFYPPYFALVSLIFFHFLGVGGIYVIPVLASTGCLVFTFLIVRQLGHQIKSTWALLILAFCSPLLFYSVTFWEHSLAMMFSTLCFLLVIRSRESSHPERLLLLAGTVLGLSTVFREEGYLLLCAIAVGVVYAFPVRRRGVFLLIGWFLVMIPIWIIQHHLYDHFLGIHAVIYSSALSGPGDALSLFNPANTISN